jgi:GNAT superfamily N-acetyltransferase
MGANNADFHGVTITHEPLDDGTTWVEANHPEHGYLGGMQLAAPSEHRHGRTVLELEVRPEHRRKGVATGLWNYAKQQGLDPAHDTWQTKEGSAWAKAVGD